MAEGAPDAGAMDVEEQVAASGDAAGEADGEGSAESVKNEGVEGSEAEAAETADGGEDQGMDVETEDGTEESKAEGSAAGEGEGEGEGAAPKESGPRSSGEGEGEGEATKTEEVGEKEAREGSEGPDGDGSTVKSEGENGQVGMEVEGERAAEEGRGEEVAGSKEKEEEQISEEELHELKQQRWSDSMKDAEMRVKRDQFDVAAWETLMSEVRKMAQSPSFPKCLYRDVFERFVSIFPSSGRHWRMYIDVERAAKEFGRVEKLFQRSLAPCYNNDLWLSYIEYVKLANSDSQDALKNISDAYDFALRYMTPDKDSTKLWNGYISYLQSLPATGDIYEDSQRMTRLRRLFQRAVEQPIQGVEGIWQQWEAFEHEQNTTLAKELTQKRLQKYMAARAVFRERKALYEHISFDILPVPPSNTPESAKMAQQLVLWKRILEYEQSNPLRLEPDALRARMIFTYNQCLVHYARFPEPWLLYAEYLLDEGLGKDVAAVFDRAREFLPDSLLISFALADYLEQSNSIAAAKKVYQDIVKHHESALVYIHYMNFCRRTEGLHGFREAFSIARRSPHCTHEVFIFSALTEFRLNKDAKIARRIFEFGLNKYSQNPDFVIAYANFLRSLNDEQNVRVLFERVLSSGGDNPSPETWNAYLRFERDTGDLSSLAQIEKRYAATVPHRNVKGVLSLVHRYCYGEMWPCTPAELQSLCATDVESSLASQLEALDAKRSRSNTRGGRSASTRMLSSRSMRTAELAEKYPRPDVSSLVKYVPEVVGYPIGPMGVPLPPRPQILDVPLIVPPPSLPESVKLFSSAPQSIMRLFNTLPAPSDFPGPRADVDRLIGMLKGLDIAAPRSEGPDVGSKRAPPERGDADAPDAKRARAPVQDVYRQRQAAKLSRTSLL